MKKVKIFLASSNELAAERQLFEIEIYRKCKQWLDNDIFLHLDIWEDLSAKMSKTNSQDEYNKHVKNADIVVILAYTKIGKYTLSEFESANRAFNTINKPFIYVYFKSNPNSTRENRSDLNSLYEFQDMLDKGGYFFPSFNDFNELWKQFNKELDRLSENEFREMQVGKRNIGDLERNSIRQKHSGSGDNIGGDKITVI